TPRTPRAGCACAPRPWTAWLRPACAGEGRSQADRAVESADLLLGEAAVVAGGEPGELDGAEPRADQAPDRRAGGLQHAANLPVAALDHPDLQHLPPAGPGDHPRPLRSGGPVLPLPAAAPGGA